VSRSGVTASATPLTIESLDQEGRGVARRDGKAVFVEGALPQEQVTVSIYRRKPSFELASLQSVLRASAARAAPRCASFGICGGCVLQHVELSTQVAVKQRVLEDALWHIGRVEPDELLAPIHGLAWGYRHRARFTARYVPKKGGMLIGFHEKRSSYVADMSACEVVPPRISALLVPLREALGALSVRQRVPQVELAIGEGADVLVLRVLEPLTHDDEAHLRAFADRQGVYVYLQPAGPETARPFHPPGGADLHYVLPEFDVRIGFEPTDFTQVNHEVNRVLVRRAIQLLEPRPGEHILDLFCGVGNFALPIARCGARVVGVEGSSTLVARARANAERNRLAASCRFETCDLSRIDAAGLNAFGPSDRMLVDPPRDGAVEVMKALDEDAPRCIVYVSCNPATLARDAAVLVHEKGYKLRRAGAVNMFAHTAHVESIAQFVR
jgi:23S rRNA (uracil1939-C5)-methyltransferase